MPFDGTLADDWLNSLASEIEDWRQYLDANPDAKGTMDFETRSECNLKRHGSWIYAQHPSTQAMVLKYKLPGHDHVSTWHMAHPQHLIAESPLPYDLFAYLLAGGLIEAHNAFFERMIWRFVMFARHGWPAIKHEQWRCSAAKACAASLPRALEDAAEAMHLTEQKDMAGHALMKKMSKPRKLRKQEIKDWCNANGWEGRLPGKNNPALPVVYHEEEADLYRLWEYCEQDVLTEEALSDSLPDLSPDELLVWQMDQQMNEDGGRFDLELAKAALDMADAWRVKLNKELEVMTGVSSATKRQAVKDWLTEHEDVDLPDTKAETLEWYVANEQMSGRARRVCEITMDVNRTSTAKYKTMLDKADPDDWRVRDLLMYHGAGTGRWSGKGVQVHNFPARDLIVKDFDEAAELIKSGDVDWVHVLYTDVMKFLSHALRGTIVPAPGRDLIVADYSAIEARNVLWLADAQPALDVFRRGEDIYCDMATGIYGYKVTKGVHKVERQFGKQAILGLGYGMGFVTFLLTCRKYKIYFTRADALRIMGPTKMEKYEGWVRDYLCLGDPPLNLDDPAVAKKWANKRRQANQVKRRLRDAREDPAKIVHELAIMKYTVDVYRSRYPEVKQMWKDQEAAAIRAVREWKDMVETATKHARAEFNRSGEEISYGQMEWETTAWKSSFTGPTIKCGKISWFVDRNFLYCKLPSGRLMAYREPDLKDVRTSWGEVRPALRYMHVNGRTRKWERTATYGGKIVENITQAVARDIMSNAMMLAYEGGVYRTTMSVHDELVCEVGENEGSLKDFEALMSSVPFWAHDCPITAEAERYKRYRK